LAYINEWISQIDPEEHFYLHCAGGYRSMMAASILQARGYRNFTEIEGGFKAIAQTIFLKVILYVRLRFFLY
jgi:rhodanese-related sulfurtransferase